MLTLTIIEDFLHLPKIENVAGFMYIESSQNDASKLKGGTFRPSINKWVDLGYVYI